MSRLNEIEIERTKQIFKDYKEREDLNIARLAAIHGFKTTTLQGRFRRTLGKEFHEISKHKIKRKKALNKEIIKNLFEEYKNSEIVTTRTLGEKFGVSEATIQNYFREFYNDEYRKITKIKSNLSGPRKLSKNQIKDSFENYKNSTLTLKAIAKELKINPRTLWYNFNKYFKEDYTQFRNSKQKKAVFVRNFRPRMKITEEDVKAAFWKYRQGELISKLENELKVKKGVLLPRLRKIIGKEYTELAKKRKPIDQGRGRKNRIPDEIIINLFETYKKNHVPLEELAKSIERAESSLVSRFQVLFGEDYKKIAFSRRNERKASKLEYEIAFGKYRNTNISLTELSEELGIKISSLAPRLRRMYGNLYTEIAAQKQDLIHVDKKGRIAEELALEYLNLIGLNVLDTRRKCIIKGCLKKPDFILDDTFIEVKNNYVTMEGFGNIKGYRKILNDYLGRIVTNEQKTLLNKGIIISFSGFSPNVRNQASLDKIVLIGPEEIKDVFTKNKRQDLVGKFNELREFSNPAL